MDFFDLPEEVQPDLRKFIIDIIREHQPDIPENILNKFYTKYELPENIIEQLKPGDLELESLIKTVEPILHRIEELKKESWKIMEVDNPDIALWNCSRNRSKYVVHFGQPLKGAWNMEELLNKAMKGKG